MPIPNAVSTRIDAELADVDASTDLDLLISLIDVGQRSGLDISTASAELLNRANLVDSNTSAIVASKIAAGLFKIDYPIIDLWSGASGGTGAGHSLGQLVNGYFGGNPKYVPANGNRYLVSAYPDMAALLTAGATSTYYEPVSSTDQVLVGNLDNTTWRELGTYIDGDVIMVSQQPTSVGRGFLLGISTDGGVTWRGSLPNAGFTALAMPEAYSLGYTDTGTKTIIEICKMDAPGQYAALIAGNTANARVCVIITDDYGVTWRNWATGVTGQSVAGNHTWKFFYRNGVFLMITPLAAYYTLNNGAQWLQLTDASWSTNITTLARDTQLSSDGYLTYANASTSLIYFQWPATPAGWATNLAWTTVASKFAAAATQVKKCGNFWVAWNTTTANVYVSATMTGTYTANATGLTNTLDVVELNGVFYFHVTTTTGRSIYTATAALSFTGTFAELAHTTFPSNRNGTTALRWPCTFARFGINIGAAATAIYYRHGRESIAKLTAPNSAGVSSLFGATPNYMQPQFCYKYGLWFCSVPQQGTTTPTSWTNYTDDTVAQLHFRSADGKNWTPIGPGRSGIIDAGTRLLRLTGSCVIEQSTDGITWNTTGITQPPISGANIRARLWRVKDAIFVYVGLNADNSSAQLHVSVNNGSTWTAITSFINSGAVASIRSGITYFQGKYYALNPYASGNANNISQSAFESVTIYASSDAVTWASVYGTTFSAGSYSTIQAGMFSPSPTALFIMAGPVSSNTQQLPLVTSDGRTFSSATGSSWTQQWQSAQSRDFDCSNGDMRWYVDKSFTYQATALRSMDIYKGNQLECTIINATQQLTQYAAVAGAGGYFLAATAYATFQFTPASAAFMVPLMGANTTVPLPYMRVAN